MIGDARKLSAHLAAFERGLGAGDEREAGRALSAAVGLELPPPGPAPRARVAPMMRYGLVREVDVAALIAGARPAAKFEDLSAAAAQGLAARLAREGLSTVVVGPYSKRFDVGLSYDARSRKADRFVVIGSRGDAARRVAEAERARGPEGARRAGLSLGYPPCCVERFVAVASSAEAEAEGINEAALRSFVGGAEAAPCGGQLIPWELNPLSLLSPIGFMPCSTRCEAALTQARAVLGALPPRAREAAGVALRRPVLFLRYALFWVLAGAGDPSTPWLSFDEALLNDDGEPSLEPLRGEALARLGRALEGPARLRLDDALRVARAGDEGHTMAVLSPGTPRLLCFV